MILWKNFLAEENKTRLYLQQQMGLKGVVEINRIKDFKLCHKLEAAPSSFRTRPNSVEMPGNVVVAGLSDSNCRGREADEEDIDFEISQRRSLDIPK